MDTDIRVERHVGWLGDNLLVQRDRRPFGRRMARVLQVAGLPATGGPPSERRIAAGIDTRIYYTYPLLFYVWFPDVSLAQLRALSLSGSYLFDYVLSLDEVLDRPTLCKGGNVLLGGALYREALCRLCTVLPASSGFWSHFDRYFEHFCQAVLHEEARHRGLVRSYPPGEMEMIYAGKAAVAKACLAALAALGGDDRPLDALETSHDSFYVAFQLADDLADWRVDYQRGHYSYPLTEAFLRAGWQRRVESARRPSVSEVGELLTLQGMVEEMRALALTHLDRATDAIGEQAESGWHAAIRTTRDRIIRSAFETKPPDETPAVPTRHGDGKFWGDGLPTPAPIAAVWRAWLDSDRVPRVVEDQITQEQRRVLEAAGTPRTTGEALYQIGSAIVASKRACPQWDLAVHMGITPGELSWFDSHGPWLDALLELGLDQPPELWTPDQPAKGGWVPPAVGRYIGHRLVQECARELPPGAPPTVDAVFGHYRSRSVV